MYLMFKIKGNSLSELVNKLEYKLGGYDISYIGKAIMFLEVYFISMEDTLKKSTVFNAREFSGCIYYNEKAKKNIYKLEFICRKDV